LRRVAWPWRVVFVVYAIALTLGTHWPELRITAGPASDKVIHLLAFAGFTILLWCTRWLPATWMVAVVAAAFAALDELTQGLAVLNRWVSWEDLAVNELGVGVALAWIWASGLVGGPANRMRLAYRMFGWAELFLGPSFWALLGLTVAGSGAIFALLGWGLAWLMHAWHLESVIVIGSAIGAGMLAAYLVLTAAWRRWETTHGRTQPCFRCGRPCREATFDDAGWGACPTCTAPIHRGQWLVPVETPLRVLLSVAGFTAILAITAVVLLLASAYSDQTVRLALRMSADTYVAFMLACIAFLGALCLRGCRDWFALLHDRQHLVCRRCRHDLRGTPLEQGIGQCGECGAPFVDVAAEGREEAVTKSRSH
jgi:hypothetical protein